MSTPTLSRAPFEGSLSTKRQLYAVALLSAMALAALLVWPPLRQRLLATNFLPHLYCYFVEPGVSVDPRGGRCPHRNRLSCDLGYARVRGFQGASRPALSLGLLGVWALHHCLWRYPLHGSADHRIPVYVLSAAVKLFTAIASVTTAVVLPFIVPRIFTLVQQAKTLELATAELSEAVSSTRFAIHH